VSIPNPLNVAETMSDALNLTAIISDSMDVFEAFMLRRSDLLFLGDGKTAQYLL